MADEDFRPVLQQMTGWEMLRAGDAGMWPPMADMQRRNLGFTPMDPDAARRKALWGGDRLQQLQAVQRAMQGLTYEAEGYGRETWQAPAETWERKAGDCEDKALLGAGLLSHMGVPENEIGLLTGRAPGGEGHAVLLTPYQGRMWVLDPAASEPYPYPDQTDFQAQMLFSGDGLYAPIPKARK